VKASRYELMASPLPERACEYRAIAEKLRTVASAAKEPSVKAELTWLAHSYDRLADKAEADEPLAIVEGKHLEIPQRPAKSR
jgi:hypothetical protein